MVMLWREFFGRTVQPEFIFEVQKRQSSLYKYTALFIHLVLLLLCWPFSSGTGMAPRINAMCFLQFQLCLTEISVLEQSFP